MSEAVVSVPVSVSEARYVAFVVAEQASYFIAGSVTQLKRYELAERFAAAAEGEAE